MKEQTELLLVYCQEETGDDVPIIKIVVENGYSISKRIGRLYHIRIPVSEMSEATRKFHPYKVFTHAELARVAAHYIFTGQWLADFPDFTAEELDLPKGADSGVEIRGPKGTTG